MRTSSAFLAVGLVLILAGSVGADLTVVPYTVNLGTTQWTNAESVVGGSSLQCNNPVAGGTNYAGVLITGLGDPTVANFSGWDYWTKSNSTQGGLAFHGINMRIWLDTPYENYPGEDWDIALNIMPHNMMGDDAIPGDTWVNLSSADEYQYQIFAWDSAGNYLGGNDLSSSMDGNTWSEFQALTNYHAYVAWSGWDQYYDFSQATIKKISLRTGGGGIIEDVTAYLDDFTMNGVLVEVENGFTVHQPEVVPEPFSCVLFAGSVLGGLVIRRRRTV